VTGYLVQNNLLPTATKLSIKILSKGDIKFSSEERDAIKIYKDIPLSAHSDQHLYKVCVGL
jgi:hypothetical protein